MSASPCTYLSRGVLSGRGSWMSFRCRGRKADVCAGGRREPPRSSAEGMVVVVVVVVVVVEVVVVGGAAEVVIVVVVAEAVAVVVVVLPGVSEVPCGAESEDDAEGATSAEPEVADGATLGTGSTFSVPGAAGAAVDVVAVTGGTEEATSVVATALVASVVAVSGLLSPPPEEQAEPTSPKTAAIATAKTNFACLTTKKPLIREYWLQIPLFCFLSNCCISLSSGMNSASSRSVFTVKNASYCWFGSSDIRRRCVFRRRLSKIFRLCKNPLVFSSKYSSPLMADITRCKILTTSDESGGINL